jgi:hypothetical protein
MYSFNILSSFPTRESKQNPINSIKSEKNLMPKSSAYRESSILTLQQTFLSSFAVEHMRTSHEWLVSDSHKALRSPSLCSTGDSRSRWLRLEPITPKPNLKGRKLRVLSSYKTANQTHMNFLVLSQIFHFYYSKDFFFSFSLSSSIHASADDAFTLRYSTEKFLFLLF